VASHSGQIRADLSEVLMAQDFQDLTGQVIQKVITLVQEVEEKLVQLIRITSSSEALPAREPKPRGIEAEGPQMKSQQGADTVSGQDEVDDLLSSLGF
jgi:chemotaxis protein CheZ